MKVTFVFNYMTQHQYPFAKAMYELIGDDFLFLSNCYLTVFVMNIVLTIILSLI